MSNRRRPRSFKDASVNPTAGVPDVDGGLFDACVKFVPRTGATQMQLRYCEEESPTIWMAVALFADGRFEVGAAARPDKAIYRMLAELVDGGVCQHCKRRTGFDTAIAPPDIGQPVCWYSYDPELQTIRRGCE